jgi:hypothetical protein
MPITLTAFDSAPNLSGDARVLNEQAVPTMKRLRWFGAGTLMLNVAIFIAALHMLMPSATTSR